MKILILGDGVLLKELNKSLKKKKHSTTLLSLDVLDRAEDLKEVVKNGGYEVAVFCAINFSLKNDEIDAQSLIRFKNIQYASILYGIKKLLVITDASDIADLNEDNNALTLDNNALLSPIITSLALKDKISTVLRFFYLFGKGIKRGGAARILSAVGQRKTVQINEDFLFSAVFVLDAVEIIQAFIENNLQKNDYSITSDELISSVEFTKKIKSAAKKRGKQFNVDIKNAQESDRIFGDINDKLKSQLPNVKFTSLNSAISKTLD